MKVVLIGIALLVVVSCSGDCDCPTVIAPIAPGPPTVTILSPQNGDSVTQIPVGGTIDVQIRYTPTFKATTAEWIDRTYGVQTTAPFDPSNPGLIILTPHIYESGRLYWAEVISVDNDTIRSSIITLHLR